MAKQQPYYLAVKISSDDCKAADEQYLLLTDTPCLELWSEQIDKIAINDPKLLIKFTQTSAMRYPIFKCATPSQIMYAINIWLDSASLANIMTNAPELKLNHRATTAIFAKIHIALSKKILPIIAPDNEFSVNQLYYKFASRKFPISDRSDASWKKLYVESFNEIDNYMIKIAKGILLASGPGEGDTYTDLVAPPKDWLINKFGSTIEEFLDKIDDRSYTPNVMQFIAWVRNNFQSFNQDARARIFNMCIAIAKDGKLKMPNEKSRDFQAIMQPKIRDVNMADRVEIINALDMLISSDRDKIFVEFVCALLTCERYVFILQLPRIIHHLTVCMNQNRGYTNLIAYAMSFAMFYVAMLESTTNIGDIQSPFIFSHESICAFPIFNDITPYVPGGAVLNHNTPFHIDGERRPVDVGEISARLNAAMVRPGAQFNILSDINWHNDSLILTGSRYASALWIGPREREHYNGDYGRYIKEYIGHSCDILDEILSLVDTSGEPLLNILGKNFSKNSDKKIEQEAHEELKKDIAANHEKTLADEFDEIFPIPAATVSTDEKKDVELAPEPELPVNEKVRELFIRLKFADDFNNHSDIDIGHVGTTEDFDATTAKFVLWLRKFGRAVALKFQKERSYTWVIVTDFLNFTIDFFHSHYANAAGLILRYMTSYPRCWFDGITHFGTAEYVCARMSGINSRYIYTMNNPIYTLMKCAKREDISTLFNFNEQIMVKKWLEVNMPAAKIIFGNVSMTNSFFGPAPAEFVQDNVSKPWIFNPMVMPKSREKLLIWSNENTGQKLPGDEHKLILGKKIIIAKPSMFASYINELTQLEYEARNR